MTDTLEKEKEAVARIIDPNVWALIDHWRNKLANRPDLDVRIEEKAKPSLSKAGWIIDKIEASRSPSPQPQAVSEDRAREVLASVLHDLPMPYTAERISDGHPIDIPSTAARRAKPRFATDTQPVAGGASDRAMVLEEAASGIRIAIWNVAKGRGMSQDTAIDLVNKAMDEPAMKAAIRQLTSSPPEVVES